MISSLSNFDIIEPIYEGSYTVVYRGTSKADNQPVTVKVLRSEYPTPRQLAGLRHEYELLKELNIPGVVKAYALEKWQNGLALILEDFGGQPLSELIAARKIDFTTSLQIAITLAETIGLIHQQHIVHKDIKPQNILVNINTGHVNIVDFGIATRLSQENQRVGDPNVLEGTPAYMSPEQTGRMNRVVDYRTDYYSLGVTLYEMWTGSLPFRTTDPMEMIHSHIARVPPPPHEVLPTIPRPVSEIVLKLLSKAAEDRYQSSDGLKADLEACLKQWQAAGSITPFPLGQHDATGILRISQKLYGREAELSTLMAAFERISQGATELMLVSGYAGIGKSALVNEIHKPVARQRGYFIAGKFDQYRRNIPYASVIQAFQDLLRQLSTESVAQVARWKDQIIEAVGANGQIIIDVIPEVELIIGPQPHVPQLGPTESQNRFKMTFQNFINVFAKPEHPLVIFLDDLQWADLASLKLIELLITDPHTRYLLLICAYRDNEVNPAHPALIAFDELRKAQAPMSEITLRSLGLTHVNQLIADTLDSDPAQTQPLAELVRSKTDGNPFFLNQFLKSLYREQLLSFDVQARTWRWDLDRIRAAAITDNVSILMAESIRKLRPQTQRMLQFAACIGNQFDLAILSIINEQSAAATAADLWEAIQAGLILPLDAEYKLVQSQDPELAEGASDDFQVSYKFLHDRVQQAAYSLIPVEQTEQIHLSIGRLLLAHTAPDEREERIFEIINQLNAGVELITDPTERIELARLNLIAGKKARASNAYESAVGYLSMGMYLLPKGSWRAEYDLALALHQECSECEYLSGHFDAAESLSDTILRYAHSNHEKAQVYIARMGLYTTLGRYADGVGVGLEGLQLFGIAFPEREEERQAAIGGALGAVQQNLADRKIEELLNAPELVDPDKKAIMQLLVTLGPLSFNTSPNLFALIILEMVNISLKHGNLDVSAYAYSAYGVLLASVIGAYQSAHAFGKLSIDLNERFNNAELKNKLNHVLGTFIDHWRTHISSSITYLKQAYLDSIEIGDIVYAGFASMGIIYHKIGQGVPLHEVADDLKRYLAFVRQTKNEAIEVALTLFQQWITSLQGRTKAATTLDDDRFDEALFLEKLKQANLISLLNVYYIYKAQLLFIHGRYNDALAMALDAEKTIAVSGGAYLVSEMVFYSALIRAALYPVAPAEEQQRYWKQLTEQRDQMKIWAENCPENADCKYLLIAAEMARLSGDDTEAAALYDAAITSAETYGFIQNAAVAHEVAARFYLSQGKRKFARAYLLEAYDAYLAWGAATKVHQLAEQYPAFFGGARTGSVTSEQGPIGTPRTSTPSMTIHRHAGLLDVTTVIKAAQIISSEIILDQLLEKLMKVVVENAGAQRGLLILNRDGQLSVEAAIVAAEELTTTRPALPIEASSDLSAAIVRFVVRTKQLVVLQDASEQNPFSNDPYILAHKPKSLLALPLIHQGHLTGVLYLENNLATNAFPPDRVELLGLLSLQGAIAIENALLYAHVQQMTRDLQSINERLEESNRSLEGNVAQRTAELSRMNGQLQLELSERKRAEEERARLQEEVIRMQAAALEELSTPVIPLTNHIMVMPLIGSMDSRRAQQVLTSLLNGVSAHRAQVVIIDITGVVVVDTSVAGTLINAAQSIRLLGAQTVITGIRPEIAQTLVGLGIDLNAIVTAGTLQSGIAYALRQSGEAHLFQNGYGR